MRLSFNSFIECEWFAYLLVTPKKVGVRVQQARRFCHMPCVRRAACSVRLQTIERKLYLHGPTFSLTANNQSQGMQRLQEATKSGSLNTRLRFFSCFSSSSSFFSLSISPPSESHLLSFSHVCISMHARVHTHTYAEDISQSENRWLTFISSGISNLLVNPRQTSELEAHAGHDNHPTPGCIRSTPTCAQAAHVAIVACLPQKSCRCLLLSSIPLPMANKIPEKADFKRLVDEF